MKEQGVDGPVGCQGVRQLLHPGQGGDHAEVEVELRQGLALRHMAADAPEVAVGHLAAPQRQQPHRVGPEGVADILDLGRRERLPGDLDGAGQHGLALPRLARRPQAARYHGHRVRSAPAAAILAWRCYRNPGPVPGTQFVKKRFARCTYQELMNRLELVALEKRRL